jgi:tetratricopeptide (TPR) repeat protein
MCKAEDLSGGREIHVLLGALFKPRKAAADRHYTFHLAVNKRQSRSAGRIMNRTVLRLATVCLICFAAHVLKAGTPVEQANPTEAVSPPVAGACSQEPYREGQGHGSRGEYEAGLCLLKQGRLEEAEKAFRSALLLDPKSAAAHEALGEVFLGRKDTASAEAEFTSALQLNPHSLTALFNLGTALIGEKKYAEAMWQMLEVLKLNPKYVPAMGSVSFILDRLGDNDAALSYLQMAVQLVPRSADLQVFLGSHQFEDKQYAEACASYRKAIQLDLKSGRGHYGLGVALLKVDPEHKSAEAAAEFKTAIRLDPRNAYSHFELGKLALQQEDFETAAFHLKEAARLQPELSGAYSELGRVYQRQHNLEDAEKVLRIAVRLDPELVSALYRLGQVLQARGLGEEANTYFAKVRQIQDQSHRQPLQALQASGEGLKAMSEGRLDDAVSAFRRSLSLDPSARRAYRLGDALFQQGKTEEAIQYLRQATQMSPSFLSARIELAKALESVDDASAQEEWRKAELLDRLFATEEEEKPRAVDAAIDKYNAAVSLMQEGKLSLAAEGFRNTLKLAPDLAEAHFALGVILMRQGNQDGAKKEFSTVVRLDPENSDAHNNLGVLLAQEEDYNAALWHILEVLRLNPKNVSAQINLSNILISAGNVEGALSQLQRAVQANPDNAFLLFYLGRAQFRDGKGEMALRTLQQALALNPSLPQAHSGLGEVYLMLGRTAEASAEFNAALQLDPNFADAHFQLGKMALQEGKKDEACTHLREAVRLKPRNYDAHIELGKAYAQLQRTEAAEREFRAAMTLRPDQPEAVYNLAHLETKRGRTEQAKSYFRQFEELDRRSRAKDAVAKLNAEGNEFRKQRRLDEAVACFKKALSIDANSADVAYNLGLALAGQDKTEDEIQAFRLAVRARPSFVDAQDALAVALEGAGDPSAQEERRKANLLKNFVSP